MTAPHLVLAHGFTQTARSWEVLRAHLGAALPGATCAAIDLPGHGTAGEQRGDLWAAADHLVAAGGPGVYVGYSMGGRVSLHAALSHPDVVERLVLIGATAGLDDAEDRAERRRADEAIAQRLERDGVERFVDWWLTNPLFAGLDETTALRDDRLRNDLPGLAASLRDCGTGTQDPLWDRLPSITAPVLLLVGEHDAKFRGLGERMASGLPNARLEVITDAGHSVHLEQPRATAAAIARWLST